MDPLVVLLLSDDCRLALTSSAIVRGTSRERSSNGCSWDRLKSVGVGPGDPIPFSTSTTKDRG